MKKTPVFLHILYYLLVPVALITLLLITSLLMRLMSPSGDLGSAIAATYAFLFLGVPVLSAVLMRLSFLKWYVDPIAAAELPLALFAMMVVSNLRRMGEFCFALSRTWNSLLSDGGEGMLFFLGLFLFGLLFSFSPARKRGESFSFRLFSRISPKKS